MHWHSVYPGFIRLLQMLCWGCELDGRSMHYQPSISTDTLHFEVGESVSFFLLSFRQLKADSGVLSVPWYRWKTCKLTGWVGISTNVALTGSKCLSVSVCADMQWNKGTHIHEMSLFHFTSYPLCSHKQPYTDTVYALAHTHTHCLWLPACFSFLSKIKVLPFLCEYITLL